MQLPAGLAQAAAQAGVATSPSDPPSAQQELAASDGAARDFGYSVSLNAPGDEAVVGAPDIAGGTAGAAYVFVRRPGSWVLQAKLTPSDGVPGISLATRCRWTRWVTRR